MAGIPSHSTIETSETSTGTSYTPALVALAILYFMMGFITCLNDTLVPFFKKGFTLTYSESSLVQFYFFLTYAIMSIPAARIVSKVGYQRGMVFGFLTAALGALLFFPASIYHQYAMFLAALFVLAIGIVLLQVAANPYITALGPAKSASSRFTLIQGVGSLGTTVASFRCLLYSGAIAEQSCIERRHKITVSWDRADADNYCRDRVYVEASGDQNVAQ